MSEGFKYEGAKQSRCVIVPAISDGGIGGAALLASGGDGAGVLLWRAGAQQPAVTLTGKPPYYHLSLVFLTLCCNRSCRTSQ